MRRVNRRVTSAIASACAVALVAGALAGCGSRRIRYVDNGRESTLAQAERLAEQYDVSPWNGLSQDEASQARADALRDLRAKEGDGARLADILTASFRSGDRSVPVYAETGRVDGRDAWIVIETWASAGQPLGHRRLWVLSRPGGEVLAASSYR